MLRFARHDIQVKIATVSQSPWVEDGGGDIDPRSSILDPSLAVRPSLAILNPSSLIIHSLSSILD